ncbi:hypothetical protein SAMN06272737_10261 [Blastococcus mobilis]|uniref:Uncharacterized protein n=1 Tax=Blastococcus mobilis TaxID=1938746 RepID=A0A238V5F5_9ACTN|nr:hypothetical protein SAMN06272737_10261 [Blastococcus mobilis]
MRTTSTTQRDVTDVFYDQHVAGKPLMGPLTAAQSFAHQFFGI